MLKRLKNLLPASDSLKGRALQAGGWNLFQMFALNILKLGSNLIMTRLLLPDAFALLSFVFLVITALTLATDVGLRQSIIREPDGGNTEFLQTVWVMKIAHGVLIAVLILCVALGLHVSAPLWAPEGTIYADPRLPGLIVFSAVIPLISGLQSTCLELAERQISYKRVALIEIVSQVIGIVCMISFAQISATVWALMAGATMAFVARSLGAHLFLPGPAMRWRFDVEIAWRVWHFGKWLIGSSLFTFAGRNSDKLILGALLNITTMGLLTISFVWIAAGQMIIQRLVGKVAYPVLSEINRDRAQDLPRLLPRVQRSVDILCLSGFAAGVLLGPSFVKALYTETYHLAGYMLALLSLSMLCLRFEVLSNLLMTLGDSRGLMWLWAQRAALLIVFLVPCYTMFGLKVALGFVALHPLASVPFLLFRLKDRLDRRTRIENIAWMLFILILGALVVATSPLEVHRM